ncbi:MAG: glucose 1-dehydrogenase [bacterium]|nr:glucose 1-dehydrogenase [bacterium]
MVNTFDATKLFNLNERIAIVTGAARGNGRAIAEGLAAVGVSVVLADILSDELKRACQSICGRGQKAHGIITDLCKPEDLKKLVKQTIDEFGRIDILINCAAVNIEERSENYPEEAWEKTLDVNVKAVFRLSKLVAKHMIAQKSGNIINITSIGAVRGFPNNPAYQASKGALQQLTRAMACDWSKYNIRVNNLCPGYFRTEMTKRSWSNPRIKAQRVSHSFLKRWGESTELVGPVIFLASDASSYISGNDLFVDGGFAKTGLVED